MFLQEVFKGYTLHQPSYHNEIHGLDVMQMCYIILNSGLSQVANLNEIDILSYLVGALCHDVGYDRYNN